MKKVFVVLKDQEAIENFVNSIKNSDDLKIDGNVVSFTPTNDNLNLKSSDIMTHWSEKSSIEDYYKKIISLNNQSD
jgi:hypothetical protein